MAPKKRRTKTAAPRIGPKEQQGGITLPAFGLAEDILAGQAPAGDSTQPSADTAAGPDASPAPAAAAGTAASVPAGAANSAGDDELHLVTFRLDAEEYAVDIRRVQEIIRVGAITAVPNSLAYIQGVINLRGRVIPVLNLRKRLDLPERSLTRQSRIMIVETGAKVLGMLVDGVSQVLRFPAAAVEPPPDEGGQKTGFVSGIGRVDSRLILLMNLDRVLAREVHKTAAA